MSLIRSPGRRPSAANWRRDWQRQTDRGQSFDVAEESGRVVGFVWASPWADSDGYDAAIRGLYVLPTRQGTGIGKRLLLHAAGILVERGCASLEIGCARENPSCGFYRHLGGQEIGRRPLRVDRFDTEEILFGWKNIQALL